MTQGERLDEAKILVRQCLGIFGQLIDDETVELVARKIVLTLPKSFDHTVPQAGER